MQWIPVLWTYQNWQVGVIKELCYSCTEKKEAWRNFRIRPIRRATPSPLLHYSNKRRKKTWVWRKCYSYAMVGLKVKTWRTAMADRAIDWQWEVIIVANRFVYRENVLDEKCFFFLNVKEAKVARRKTCLTGLLWTFKAKFLRVSYYKLLNLCTSYEERLKKLWSRLKITIKNSWHTTFEGTTSFCLKHCFNFICVTDIYPPNYHKQRLRGWFLYWRIISSL